MVTRVRGTIFGIRPPQARRAERSPLPSRFGAGNHGGPNVAEELVAVARARRNEDDLCVRRLRDFHLGIHESAEGQQHHSVSSGGARNAFFEALDRLLQAADDGAAFAGGTFTAGDGSDLFGFRIADGLDVGRLRQIFGSDSSLLGSVFFVVGLHNGRIRLDAGDQNVSDHVAVSRHGAGQFLLDVLGDFSLVLLHVLEAHLRNLIADGTRNVRLDLTLGFFELVESKLDMLVGVADDILNVRGDRDRRALVRIGRLRDHQLANAQAERRRHRVEKRHLEIETRTADLDEFAEASHHSFRLLVDDEDRASDQNDGGESENPGERNESHHCFLSNCWLY